MKLLPPSRFAIMAPTLHSGDMGIDGIYSSKHGMFLNQAPYFKPFSASLVQSSPYLRNPDKQELRGRQSDDSSFVIIPTTYHGITDGPSAAVILGIVLGSIGGLLVLFSIFYMSCIRRDRSGDFGSPSPASTSRTNSRYRYHGSSHARSRAKKMRSHRKPGVKARRHGKPSASLSRSIPRSSRYTGDGRSARYPSPVRRSYQRDFNPRDSDEIVVIEEPFQPRRSTGGGRSRSSRGSRRSRDLMGQPMNRSSSRGMRSSIGRAGT